MNRPGDGSRAGHSCLCPTAVGGKNILRQQPRSYVIPSRTWGGRGDQKSAPRQEVETRAEKAEEENRPRQTGNWMKSRVPEAGPTPAPLPRHSPAPGASVPTPLLPRLQEAQIPAFQSQQPTGPQAPGGRDEGGAAGTQTHGRGTAGLRTQRSSEPSVSGHVCAKSQARHPRRALQRQPFREEAGARGSHPSAAPLGLRFGHSSHKGCI